MHLTSFYVFYNFLACFTFVSVCFTFEYITTVYSGLKMQCSDLKYKCGNEIELEAEKQIIKI